MAEYDYYYDDYYYSDDEDDNENLTNHIVIVVCGELMENISHVIMPLRMQNLKQHQKIVVLYEKNPSNEHWHSILKSLQDTTGVYFVLGSPLLHLSRTSISTASSVIVLNNPYTNDTSERVERNEIQIDARAVIATRSIEDGFFDNLIFSISELSQGSSIRYLGSHRPLRSDYDEANFSASPGLVRATMGIGGVFVESELRSPLSHRSRSNSNSMRGKLARSLTVRSGGLLSSSDHESENDSHRHRPSGDGDDDSSGGGGSSFSVVAAATGAYGENHVSRQKSFFDKVAQRMGSNSTNILPEYHFRPRFAAGRIYTSSMLDSLTCQAFLNPAVLAIIKLMVNSAKSAQIYLIPVHARFSGKRYKFVVSQFLKYTKMLPIGIYRAAGTYRAPLPYVFTNPGPNALVYKRDRLYVVSHFDPALLAEKIVDHLVELEEAAAVAAAASSTPAAAAAAATAAAAVAAGVTIDAAVADATSSDDPDDSATSTAATAAAGGHDGDGGGGGGGGAVAATADDGGGSGGVGARGRARRGTTTSDDDDDDDLLKPKARRRRKKK